ncbi:MAG TPA: hypothetical protein VI756_09210 [Blastocatellia bacterium]
MNFIPGICPACNGQLPLPSDRESIRCMYCGAEVRTDHAAALASAANPPQQPIASTPGTTPGTTVPSGGMSTGLKIGVAVVGAVVILAFISIAGVVFMLRSSRQTTSRVVETPKPIVAPTRPVVAPTPSASDDDSSSGATTDSDDSDDTMSGLLTKMAGDSAATSVAILANLDEAADSNITYPMLKKDPERYAGRAWALKGKVLQIFERGQHTEARIALDGWGNNVVWVEGNFSTDFVENNIVCAIGYLAGSYSYKSQAGWDITIPSLAARAIMSPQALAKMKADAAPHTNPPEATRRGDGGSSGKDRQDKVSKAERLLNQ